MGKKPPIFNLTNIFNDLGDHLFYSESLIVHLCPQPIDKLPQLHTYVKIVDGAI